MQRWLLGIVAAATLVPAGCAAPCGSGDVCAVTGHGADSEVCDGDHWRTCASDDGNHGLRIACKSSPKVAVCATAGWTFEDSGTP
jgi:hypothetical protein